MRPLRRPPALPAALALAACLHRAPAAPTPPPAASPAPASPARPDPLAAVRADAEALLAAQGERLWRAWTRGEDGEPASPPPELERLLAPGALAAVEGALGRADGDDRRALELLRAFLIGERMARDTRETWARLAAARARAVLRWDDREVPARQVPALLAAEPDAARRAALERALAEAELRWRPAAEAYRAAVDAAARGLGRASAAALAEDLRAAPVEALAARAEDVLETTQGPYRSLLEDLARRELGLPLARLRGRDLPRLLLLAQDGRAFPAAAAVPRALGTLRHLGLDLAGATLDLEPRAGKDPRPLLLPVAPPGDVRVSAAPAGGAGEARALLRTLGGAAFHRGAAAARLEFRRLGTVNADAFAGLLEELAGDPAWLAEHAGLTPHHLDPIVRAAALRRLHAAREAAARLLLELARAGGRAASPAAAREALARAFARPVDEDEAAAFLAEPDPLLRSADRLASVLLAAQAEDRLERLAGSRWWKEARSGAALAEAFAGGSRLDPEAMARALGAERLGASALAARARARGERAGMRFP
jgi:hypothetical protein